MVAVREAIGWILRRPSATRRLPPILMQGETGTGKGLLARACADYDLPPKTLAPDATVALLAYRWPGNVRELSNIMERVALLSEAQLVTAEMLGLPESAMVKPHEAVSEQAEEVAGSDERDRLLEALRRTSWNISRAAVHLGISRNTLRYRIEKHGLRPGAPSLPPLRPAEVPPAAAHSVLPSKQSSPRWRCRRRWSKTGVAMPRSSQ